ncbi:hypothetical protein BC828DRAFT_387153 [Blastocladiella britannica]|nr:hypothetical protein BC828DRAFT_387153 [Blastocladiella britannica]
MSAIWIYPVNYTVLTIAIISACVIASANSAEWKRRGMPLLTTHTALVGGSAVLVLHQALFLILTVVPATALPGGCSVWLTAEPIAYSIVQLVFSSTLISRATATLSVRSSLSSRNATATASVSTSVAAAGAGGGGLAIAPGSSSGSSSSTRITAPWRRWSAQRIAKWTLMFVFLAAFALVVMSIVFAQTGITDSDRCIYIPDRRWNVPGKLLYFLVYLTLAVLFGTTVVAHLHGVYGSSGMLPSVTGGGGASTSGAGGGGPVSPGARVMGGIKDARKIVSTIMLVSPPGPPLPTQATKSPHHHHHHSQHATAIINHNQMLRAQRPILRLVRDMTFRIMLAVLVYLVTAIAVELGAFDGGLLISYSIQNQVAAYCSTVSSQTRKSSRRGRLVSESSTRRSRNPTSPSSSSNHRRPSMVSSFGNGAKSGTATTNQVQSEWVLETPITIHAHELPDPSAV